MKKVLFALMYSVIAFLIIFLSRFSNFTICQSYDECTTLSYFVFISIGFLYSTPIILFLELYDLLKKKQWLTLKFIGVLSFFWFPIFKSVYFSAGLISILFLGGWIGIAFTVFLSIFFETTLLMKMFNEFSISIKINSIKPSLYIATLATIFSLPIIEFDRNTTFGKEYVISEINLIVLFFCWQILTIVYVWLLENRNNKKNLITSNENH